MCGIVGYIGTESSTEVILDGLTRLEYRGYDSAGIAVNDGGQIAVAKSAGKIRKLRSTIQGKLPRARLGIGHTRWATHGPPSDENAHPHLDCNRRIALVHNGIIENYLSLREALTGRGHTFASETDSEVLTHLVEENYDGDLLAAVRKALCKVEGAFAVGVIAVDEPGVLVGARRLSPLVVGLGEGENFIASDVTAIIGNTRRVHFLEDDDCVRLTAEGCQLVRLDGKAVTRSVHTVDWNPVLAEKGGYDHFMLKEIHEQPEVIRQTLGGRTDETKGRIHLPDLALTPERIQQIQRVYLVACGTAHYAGHVGKYVTERLAKLPAEAVLASEFRYADPVLDKHTLVIAISQSGETADTLGAMRLAREKGAHTVAVVNVKGSTLTREVDSAVYIHAGPEIGVASTKAYLAMLTALYLIALHLGRERGVLAAAAVRETVRELKAIPQKVDRLLVAMRARVRAVAKKFYGASDFIYLGRNVNYPTALEGALKLKEISYIHAEGYAAGEMKHGPIALIDGQVPVVAIATQGQTYDKILSNIKEVKARDGKVIALATEGDTTLPTIADEVLFVPQTGELTSPILNIVPLQLLAYYIADLRGADVDQPRNLAKSVTVE